MLLGGWATVKVCSTVSWPVAVPLNTTPAPATDRSPVEVARRVAGQHYPEGKAAIGPVTG
jgi:hypothetical protein